MTDEKIKALITQVEQMIAEQEDVMAKLKSRWEVQKREGILDRISDVSIIIASMRQVLAVIRLYEEYDELSNA